MSFRPASAPPAAPRIAAAAAPPPVRRRPPSALFSDAIALRPGAVLPPRAPASSAPTSSAPTSSAARAQPDVVDRRRAERPSRRDWSTPPVRSSAASRAPARAPALRDLHPPATSRRFRIDDADHPSRHHYAYAEPARARGLALAREEEETEGILDDAWKTASDGFRKLKSGASDALRSAKAAVNHQGAYTLNCQECKDRGDPPALDAVAHTDDTSIEGVSVPVVVVATHKQWKNSKTEPGFSVPKFYTNDSRPYVNDFIGGRNGEPSGRFPFPPTAEGQSDEAYAQQSFRDIVFAAGMEQATYMQSVMDPKNKNAGNLSAMGKGHPAVVLEKAKLGKSDGLQYPYSCVRNALLHGGNGQLLQYVTAEDGTLAQPPQENLPSVLPFPGNSEDLKTSCVYTAMAAVWIPYSMPGLWSRYACIFVPIGAKGDSVAMGHAIYVPHEDYGVVSPPFDPKTNEFFKWNDDQANREFRERNYRGERGTIRMLETKLPGYDLIGAYAVDHNMAITPEKAEAGYSPTPVLASRDLIQPYLARALDAFVSDEDLNLRMTIKEIDAELTGLADSNDPKRKLLEEKKRALEQTLPQKEKTLKQKKEEAKANVATGRQVLALDLLNATFREGAEYKWKNKDVGYGKYTRGLVNLVASFDVKPPHIYDYAMLDTAARVARMLMNAKSTSAGRALGLGELLVSYKKRKTATSTTTLKLEDYSRPTGAVFDATNLMVLEHDWDVCEF